GRLTTMVAGTLASVLAGAGPFLGISFGAAGALQPVQAAAQQPWQAELQWQRLPNRPPNRRPWQPWQAPVQAPVQAPWQAELQWQRFENRPANRPSWQPWQRPWQALLQAQRPPE